MKVLFFSLSLLHTLYPSLSAPTTSDSFHLPNFGKQFNGQPKPREPFHAIPRKQCPTTANCCRSWAGSSACSPESSSDCFSASSSSTLKPAIAPCSACCPPNSTLPKSSGRSIVAPSTSPPFASPLVFLIFESAFGRQPGSSYPLCLLATSDQCSRSPEFASGSRH
ncbi:hypothetical protein B0H16DRAFT_1891513 [Mycena metata]|uniref:Secreted protein n=1 Tax=Mycena metata TaxID=1033252 RepID=A0AAD7MYS6_9AGAR|nr:hypothetical protein B0H16DRAFT_1891513 [Mycena metata]